MEPDLFILKKFTDIDINDELNSFIGRKSQRCRVTGINGNALELEPLALWYRRFKGWKRFDSSATYQIYRDRTPRIYSKNQQIQSVLLDLSPYYLYDRAQLHELVIQCGIDARKATVSKVVTTLVKAKQLYAIAGHKGELARFRLPTPKSPGFPLVELSGKKTERLGYLVEWRLMRSSNVYHPVIRWLNGGETFSAEERLQPAAGVQRRLIETAYEHDTGKKQSGFKSVPDRLIWDLYQALTNSKRGDRALSLLAIAQHLEILPVHLKRLVDQNAANQVLTHLDRHYPGWRIGNQKEAA